MSTKIGRIFGFIFFTFALSSKLMAAQTGEYVDTGRYTEVSTTASVAQIDPLSSLITMTIPSEISTVSQAMEYVLQRSGWKLVPVSDADAQTQILYDLPLPAVHRRLGPISVREALQTLAGKPFVLVEDPVHRSITFNYVAAETEKKAVQRKSFWSLSHADE